MWCWWEVRVVGVGGESDGIGGESGGGRRGV